MAENMQNVFDVADERIFESKLNVSESGYYCVCIRYVHDNWDAWLRLDIVSENGETITYIPPLPRKYTKATMVVYLFAGENRISLAPRFDQPVEIKEISIIDAASNLNPKVIPSADWFYLSEPRMRRLTVVSYTGAPFRITAGDKEIPFELEEKALYDHADPIETKEPPTYHHLRLCPDGLSGLEEGQHVLTIHLPENTFVSYTVTVEKERREYALQVVSLDVNHGNCVLLRLPNGKNLLIDTGTEQCADEVIFPYLKEHGISIDYCLITHYHGDHMGSLDAILEQYLLAKPEEGEVRKYILAEEQEKRENYLAKYTYLDNKMLCRYDRLDQIWDLGGVEITVLNSKYEQDGRESIPGCRDENEMSVSMILSYNGFQYYHGADNHAVNQERNLADFTAAGCLNRLECYYMQANHHFHGDMLPEMIRAINPVAVVVPAHQAIFSRSAYMVDYVQGVEEADYPNKRLKDTFVSYFSGTVSALVNSGLDWHYETD